MAAISAWIVQAAFEAAVDGGHGLSTDYPLELYFGDAPAMTIPDGRTEIQKLVVGYEPTGMQAST